MKTFKILIAMFLISGCANRIPPTITQVPTPNPAISDVIAQTDAHKNRPVRWGGSILTVTNHQNDTEIEILAKELDGSGKPVDGDETLGRFLTKVTGFIDPAIYAQGRMLTVFGLVDTALTRVIGEKPYAYPVIQAQTFYLWPKEPEYADPYYYPPYGYYYNFGYYPYGYRYGYMRRR